MVLRELEELANSSHDYMYEDEFLLSLLDPTDAGARYYKFLFLVAKTIQPSLTVEIGVCTGRGTAHLASGSPNGVVMGIDPEPWDLSRILARYGNIQLVRERSDSERALQAVQDESVDLCFIDSLHDGAYTQRELDLWVPKLKDGGIFLFDDIFLNNSMRHFWDNVGLPKAALAGMHLSKGRDVGFGCVRK